ncbi:MAG: TIGR03619 family F420-dependent LLM class oxidoreductase [Thermoleophilia bacterium]|nr:TIGR03619 family F420-dependent LLM class oxidoreductase [Thermoleophilia bacterium]
MSGRTPGVVLVLLEQWTLSPERDLRALVQMAVDAESVGVETVMISDHVLLTPKAGAGGRMANSRDYAAPGNQDPLTPWPDSIVLASAIAARTSTIRIALSALIYPLRHPLHTATQLATLDLLSEGRLVVQPTVSWLDEEYAALGVPFKQRGKILDEQLAIMRAVWAASPASFQGEFYRFDDVYLEPKCWRPEGPRMWFGGQHVHGPILRRLVEYGHGFHPFGAPTADDLVAIRNAMTAAGRDPKSIEMIGGIRPSFPSDHQPGDLDEAMQAIPGKLADGYTSICFKPSQYTDDVADVPNLCRRMVAAVAAA